MTLLPLSNPFCVVSARPPTTTFKVIPLRPSQRRQLGSSAHKHAQRISCHSRRVYLDMGSVSSTGTEVYTTPPSSPSPPPRSQPHPGLIHQFPTCLDLNFNDDDFSQPPKARGICCSVENVWYSKRHWPDDRQCAGLFRSAAETEAKLAPELKKIWNSNWSLRRRSPVSVPYACELRMAGSRHPTLPQITVRPTVWIRTTDEAIRNPDPWKRLKKVVRRLGLDSDQYADIYAEGGLSLAGDTLTVSKDYLLLDKGIRFESGEVLHVHVPAKATGSSACGLLCLTTIIKEDIILRQKLSRIGGLVNDQSCSKLGVTSGHALLQYFLELASSEAPMPQQDLIGIGGSGIHSSPFSGSDSDDDDESDEDLELVDNQEGWADSESTKKLGRVCLEGITQWIPVTPFDRINFIRQAEEDSSQGSIWKLDFSKRPIPADFALIAGLGDSEFGNFYESSFSTIIQHGDLEGRTLSSRARQKLPVEHSPKEDAHPPISRHTSYPTVGQNWVSGYVEDEALTARNVLILTDDEPPHIVASLLTARVPLVIDGAQFWTRKLSLEAPLCK